MLKDISEVSAAAALEKNLRTYRDCISEGQTNDASMFEREYIADVRIHKVCLCMCVCVHTYVHLHVFTSAYASIPPSHEEKMPFFESLALGMT